MLKDVLMDACIFFYVQIWTRWCCKNLTRQHCQKEWEASATNLIYVPVATPLHLKAIESIFNVMPRCGCPPMAGLCRFWALAVACNNSNMAKALSHMG